MDISQDTPPISYSQLFSFQVGYASDSAHSCNSIASSEDQKGIYRQGLLEVDFYMEALFIQDRDRIVMSQSFSALRNHVDADYLDDCGISIKFDSEQWEITSQNVAEKTCIQHLLESIVNRTPIEEMLQIGKEKGIIGLDKSIQKHGYILRRATNHNKLEERYLILVPGKLFLFKSFDIIGKHVRYATSLLGAAVKTFPEEQEFQVSTPGSKTMSLISTNSKDYDAWVEAVETSIQHTKQAARAAGMVTTPIKKKRRGRASKVNRVQWDSGILTQKAQILEGGNEHSRMDAEAAQLNKQAVNPCRDDSPLREDCPSRAAQQESRDTTPSTKDTRRLSKAMMCLETALNEMKLAISSIRTVQMPAAALWHTANLSPPRSYKGFQEHPQIRPGWVGRHRPPTLGHNYIDALISPRTRETLVSSQHLRRSWDCTSIANTGAGLPRNHHVPWRSQTKEDLRSSVPMFREDEMPRLRTSKHPTAHMNTKPIISQPITIDQQRSTHMDSELHGITSSDEEEQIFQRAGGNMGGLSTRVSNISWEAPTGLEPEFAGPLETSTSMTLDHPASSNAFQSCLNTNDVAHQPSQMLLPDICLLEQQHASITPLGSTSKSTPKSSTSTMMSRVKAFDLRASRVSKVTFLPPGDAMNVPDGVLNGCNQNRTAMPASNFTCKRQSELLANPGMQRALEKEGRSGAEVQAYTNQTIPYGGASTSDTQGVSRSQHDPNPPSHVINPSEYSSSKELYSGRKNMITEAIRPGATANVQSNFGTQQSNGYSNLGNLYKVVPNSNLQNESLRQHTDISRRLTQEAGPSNVSAGEPPIFSDSPVTSAGLVIPSGMSTPSRRHSQTNLSEGTIRTADISAGTGVSPSQAGPYQLPGRRHSQIIQEMNQDMETSNCHSCENSRRSSLLSSMSADKVHLNALATAIGQNGLSAGNNVSLERSALVLNPTQPRNGVMPGDVMRNSDFEQAFISGADLLSKRQTPTNLHDQQSYLHAVSDESSFRQPCNLNGQVINPASQNVTDRASMPLPPTPYSLESRVTYAAETHTYDTAHTINGEVMHSQMGVEGYACSGSDANASVRCNEQALRVSPAVSTISDNMGASKCSKEAAPSVQVSDIAELVNRLVRITAGDELEVSSSFNRGALNVDLSPDPPNKTWDRQASLPMVADEATSSYKSPQTSTHYQPGSDRASMQMHQSSQMMVPNPNQDNSMTLQLLGGNGSSISGPITLKSSDGEVIIIGKERRASTGLLAPQGGEQAQGNQVNNGTHALKAQEEHFQDPSQQPSRRPSISEQARPSNGEGDAWSLAILKPGTPAQIFKFETQ